MSPACKHSCARVALVELRAEAVKFDFMHPMGAAWWTRRERSKRRLDECGKPADAHAGQLARDIRGIGLRAVLAPRARDGAASHQDAARSFGKIETDSCGLACGCSVGVGAAGPSVLTRDRMLFGVRSMRRAMRVSGMPRSTIPRSSASCAVVQRRLMSLRAILQRTPLVRSTDQHRLVRWNFSGFIYVRKAGDQEMTVHALHQGIQYQLEELRSGEWRWSFDPPSGPQRSGRVRGEVFFAHVVARRSIEIWHLTNARPSIAA